MGHRIHTLRYDEKSSKVDVTMYCSRYGSNDDPSNRFEYAYNLWVPSTGHFHHCRQTFNKYPSPECVCAGLVTLLRRTTLAAAAAPRLTPPPPPPPLSPRFFQVHVELDGHAHLWRD